MVVYQVVSFAHDGCQDIPILLECPGGSSYLVAIHNYLRIRNRSSKSEEADIMTEEKIVDFLKVQVRQEVDVYKLMSEIEMLELVEEEGEVEGEGEKDEKVESYGKVAVNLVLAFLNSCAEFPMSPLLSPLLSGALDFEYNPAYQFCMFLKINLVHGWLVNPEDNSYETVQGLLADSYDCITDYGFSSLFDEIDNDSFSVLFWHKRFDILFKAHNVLFVLVTDESLRQRMPNVVWMLFERSQEQNIYLAHDFTPVGGQPYEEKARQWYKDFLKKGVDEFSSKEADAAAQKRAKNKKKKEKRRHKKLKERQFFNQDAVKDHNRPPDEGAELDESAGAVGAVKLEDDAAASPCDESDNELPETHEEEKADNGLPDGVNSDFLEFLIKYIDKPVQNAAATDSMVQGLLNIISANKLQKNTGYAYSEFDVASEESQICFVSCADLSVLQSMIKDNGLQVYEFVTLSYIMVLKLCTMLEI